jgi:acetate kinase
MTEGTAGAAGTGLVLVVNAGSSSLKLSLLDLSGAVTASVDLDRWDGSAGTAGLRGFLASHAGQASRTGPASITAAGHRVVHGGRRFTAPAIIDDQVIEGLAALTDLAPLHQPRAIAGIEAARAALPGVPHVACFDTAFHASLPAAAASYALPAGWTARFGLRRYGFHGLSHAHAARRAAELLAGAAQPPPARPATLRIVSCHLGAGASLAAIRDGHSVDTTMGFTPLEGLVMATRSGSVDPGLLVWLLRRGGVTIADLGDKLEHASGLAGLAGLPTGSGDLRDIRQAAAAGDLHARTAIDVHAHRLRREIAAMAAAMDGLDALVFTGGIGEHQPETRAEAAAGLGFLGVAIDQQANETVRGGEDADISAPGAPVRTLVVATREDLEIARQVRAALDGADPAG